MIPTLTSIELNDILKDAQNNLNTVNENIINIEHKYNLYWKILDYQTKYINTKINDFYIKTWDDNLLNFNKDNTVGINNIYSSCIHAAFLKKPIDIFNFILSNNDYVFREDVKVYIDNHKDTEYNYLLMHDNNKNKKPFIYESTSNKININIEINNDIGLGASRFNVIELSPILHGAYSINKIDIYKINTSGNLEEDPYITLNDYVNIGNTRIILNNKEKFHKISLEIESNYSINTISGDIYPFLINHIYLYDAEFNSNSYLVSKIRCEKFIEYVNNDAYIYTNNGKVLTSLNILNAEIYTKFENNILLDKIKISTHDQKYRIAKNTKELYVKLPLILKKDTDLFEYPSYLAMELNLDF